VELGDQSNQRTKQHNITTYTPSPVPNAPFFTQPKRLVSEALAWKAAIEGLGSRVEAVEAALRALQEKERNKRKQSGWGGFFSSKPLQVEFGT
jgi:ribosomal protein S12 methylthiotransferase accessory factor YcaO